MTDLLKSAMILSRSLGVWRLAFELLGMPSLTTSTKACVPIIIIIVNNDVT